MYHRSSVYIFDRIFFILAGIKVNHKSLVGFKIRPDQTLDFGLAALERLKKSHRLIMGEML